MHDSDAQYYARLYTGPELRQLRTSATTELATLTSSTAAPVEGEDHALADLLDRIRLYTAALLVQLRHGQLA